MAMAQQAPPAPVSHRNHAMGGYQKSESPSYDPYQHPLLNHQSSNREQDAAAQDWYQDQDPAMHQNHKQGPAPVIPQHDGMGYQPQPQLQQGQHAPPHGMPPLMMPPGRHGHHGGPGPGPGYAPQPPPNGPPPLPQRPPLQWENGYPQGPAPPPQGPGGHMSRMGHREQDLDNYSEGLEDGGHRGRHNDERSGSSAGSWSLDSEVRCNWLNGCRRLTAERDTVPHAEHADAEHAKYAIRRSSVER